MSLNSDFRSLATKDIGHGRLHWVPDIWIKNSKLDIGVEYDNGKPIVAFALQYNQICPIFPDNTTRIKYFMADISKGYDYIEKFLARALYQMETKMEAKKITKFWGFVPKRSLHLITLLDKVSDAGNCIKVDGNELKDILEPHYGSYVYYIGSTTEGKKTMGVLK